MCVCYAICIVQKNNGLVDMFWGMGFVGIAIIAYLYSEQKTTLNLILNILVAIWGLRLSIFLGIRNWGKEEDFRYANWRREWGNTFYWRTFLQVHMFQGFFMLLISIPIITINYFPYKLPYLIPIYCSLCICILAILIEAIADYQKYMFRKNTDDKNAFITSGLWKYSRHPNYFGEILFWWGIFIFSIGFEYWYLAIISPAIITFLLLYVSGIPMLEKKYDHNPQYQEYKKKTSALVIWFTKM
jgi:steroid 5-alpha reductase family enzyme